MLPRSVERRPRIAFVDNRGNALLEPRGAWDWPGATGGRSTRFNRYFLPLRINDENRHAREHVTNQHGEDAPATREDRHLGSADDPAAVAYAAGPGVSIVRTKDGRAHGLIAHRGVLHPDEWEWVDDDEVARLVEMRLGCTLAQMREVYGRTGGGPLPKALRPRRDRLDRAMAEHVRGGGLARLADVLGVPKRTLQRAVQRGRQAPGPVTDAPHP